MADAFTKEAYKLIYQHPDWQATAQEYEDQFAANLYHTGYVQQAATNALTKLSNTLTAYYRLHPNPNREEVQNLTAIGEVAEEVSGRSPADWKVLEEALLLRNSESGAGQIGRWQMGDTMGELAVRLGVDEDYPLMEPDADQLNQENIQAVFEHGNLREQMTMLYNGMFLNGGKNKEQIQNSHSLKNLLLNITPEDVQQMQESGTDTQIPFELLQEMGHYGKKEDLFDTYSMARDLKRGKDYLKNKGNFITRWASGVKRAFHAAFSSKFTRSNKAKNEQVGLGLEHYERLGLGLSEREMANGMVDGQLQWKEGQSYFRMDTPVTAEGMLQTAGPSGTTLRMLGAYRLLGANKQDLLFFRLALIAWMVSSRDHSLYEVLQGSHNAGVKGEEDLSEAANMYRTIDPLEEPMIRQGLAPNGRFPHETIYLKIMDAYMQKYSDESMIDPNNEDDPFDGLDAYEIAVGAYTGELYSVMNVGSKYGDFAARMQIIRLLLDEEDEEEADEDEIEENRKVKRAVGDMGFEVAKLSSRIMQEGMEARGSQESRIPSQQNDQGEQIFDTYDDERGQREKPYKRLWMDSDHAFRGITYRGGKLTAGMKKSGTIVTDSFLSTSLLPGVALDFFNKSEENEKDKAIFRFRLDGKGSVNITKLSMMDEAEMEVLIPKGTTLQVLGDPKPSFYNKVTKEFIDEDILTQGERAAIDIDLERGRDSFWVKCQVVELQEINGPGEEKRQKMAQKREKRMAKLQELTQMRTGQAV